MTEQLYRYKGWDGFVKVDEQKQRLADTAPQLLEALEAIVDECPNPKLPYGIRVVKIASAAIAAAKGEQQ